MTENSYILSLESSADTLGICLSNNSENIAVVNYYKKNLHDKFLAEITHRILNDLEINIKEISAVAVASGPGSFTGLRIATSFAKGLCFGNDIKFIAVPNLSAFAYNALDYARSLNKNFIYSTVVSHKNIIYFQKFNSLDFSSFEIKMTTLEEFSKLDFTKSFLVGNAINKLSQNDNMTEFYNHKAEIISKYANKLFSEGIFENIDDFEPLYVQDFVPKTSTKTLNF